MATDELVTSYAALALYDGDAEITSDQLTALINATGNTVEAYWPTLFAGILKENIEEMILAVGGGGGGGGGGDAAGGDGGDGAGAVEEEKKEEEEEIDMGGGMDMFGGGGDGGDY